MCQSVGIRGNACNIDTPVISVKQTKLNFKIAIICIYPTYLILINTILIYLIEK